MTADHLDMHAADLRDEHAKAHAKLASTVPGFGAASSAAALHERLAQWEQETAEHHAELVQLSSGHRVADYRYTATDSNGGAHIASAGEDVDDAVLSRDF